MSTFFPWQIYTMGLDAGGTVVVSRSTRIVGKKTVKETKVQRTVQTVEQKNKKE